MEDCHREKDKIGNAAIHRVLGDADGFVCSDSEGQWIATGFALGMTRVVLLP